MATMETANGSKESTSDQMTTGTRMVEPHVSNANRIVVGFPFSTIKMDDVTGAAAVADMVARLCRLLAESAPADAFSSLAAEAEHLQERLRR